MTERGDSEARRRALDPQRSFIVQAPAGSGKTGLLTQRFLRLLTTVEAPEQIVAITFTRKAAAEMRRRVVEALENCEPQERDTEYDRTTRELALAAKTHADARGWDLQRYPARLRIHTIDAFCSALAAQSPVLARAGAELRVADDARDLYRRAAQRALARAGEPDAGGPAVDLLLLHRDNQVLATSGYVARMLEKREQWLPVVLTSDGTLRRRLEEDLARELLEHVAATLELFPKDSLVRLSAALASAARKRDDEVLGAWRERSGPLAVRVEDVRRWRSLAASLLTADRNPEWRSGIGDRDGFGAAQREEKAIVLDEARSLGAREALRRELRWLRAMPDPHLSDEQWRIVEAFVEVLKLAAAELELVFRETGEVDYAAILRAAIHAVRGEGEPTELALALDRRIHHLLVDEFQDTSLAQFELLEALTAEWSPGDGRTLFCVGDPMQSIYRFRQAEVGLFLRVRERGLGNVPMEALQLRSNFRSQRRLVEWCNEVFAAVLPVADSVARGAVRHAPSEHVAPSLDRAVGIHASFTPDAPVETAKVLDVLADVRRRMPGAAVGILVRQRAHVAHLAGALREAQIRFQAVELETLDSRPVVRDLLSITRALLHEGDRAAWLAVLRSPLCGLTLSDLSRLVSDAGNATLRELLADTTRIERLDRAAQSRVRSLREIFERAMTLTARRPLCRRVEALWLGLGGPATVLDAAALEDASAYFDHLRKLEARGPLPAGDALDEQFSDLFAEPDPSASQRLQVMTVHKAKGLEFDVVLLPGLGRGRSRNDPSLINWLEVPRDRELPGLLLAPIVPKGGERDAHAFYVAERLRETGLLENARLLYVAATRARCELHLFGHVKVRERDGARDMGSPEAGSALALLWPAVSGTFESAFQTDDTPAATGREAELNARLRRHSPQWRLPAPEPALQVRGLRSATAAGEVRPEFVWAGEVSRRVGSAVHAELDRWSRTGSLPLPEDLPASRARYERLLAALGVPAHERRAAGERVIDALGRTLRDEKGRWIFAPAHTEVRSEWAVSGTLGAELVDAVIDRTFRDAKGTRWIVDFKTSAHEGGALEEFVDNEVRRYREQLNRYAALLARLGAGPMRVGLYFPMLGAWREWGVDAQ